MSPAGAHHDLHALIEAAASPKERREAEAEARLSGLPVCDALEFILTGKAKGKDLAAYLKKRLSRRKKPAATPGAEVLAEQPPASTAHPPEASGQADAEQPPWANPGTPENPWRAHFDGACEPNPGEMAIGVVLTDPAGAKHRVSARLGHGTNNEAEYLAAIQALEGAHAAGARHVLLLGDSKLVVNHISGRWRAGAENLLPLLARAREAAAKFTSCEINWIPREQNADADALSMRALLGEAAVGREEAAKEVRLQAAAPGIYVAAGSDGALYAVDVPHGSCSCPDFQRNGKRLGACKHLIAARAATEGAR